MALKISAIVLVGGKYDKRLLQKCLDSVSWADEVIKVETDNLPGSFADWRNYGAQKVKGSWLLYVDSDEEVTSELKNEIFLTINHKQSLALRAQPLVISAYAIPRKNFIFGKEFKHGGQRPDYVKRLFLRSKFKGWKGELHEEPSFDGKMGYLENSLVHHKNIDISQMVEKTNQWSEIEAKLMYEAGHPKMNFFRFFSAGAREFWLRMIKQAAFLDGGEGIIYALYQVYSRLISYAKLWEKQLSIIHI